MLRGRRQVGKSRLVQELLNRSRTPAMFYDATRLGASAELGRFIDALSASTLPAATRVTEGLIPSTWDAALRLSVEDLDPARGGIIVIDEFPYLGDADHRVEAAVQSAWDRVLSHRPVLVVVIGSDLAMMELLTGYGRPLYGRATLELVVPPLDVAEVAELLRLEPADAIDAYLVVGGFPLVARAWPPGALLAEVLPVTLEDATSPLLVVGERMLAAEFPGELQARTVLEAIGAGERTFTGVADRSGVGRQALSRPLQALVAGKRVVAAEQPLSATVRSRDTRYRVADPYLRFHLRFLSGGAELVARGRGDLLAEEILRSWPAYRGRAVEPLVREAVERLLPREGFGSARVVGGYWTRTGEVEVDLVGLGRLTTPRRVELVGSVKWRERAPFDRRDLAALEADAARVPGVRPDTARVVVSRSGADVTDVDEVLEPGDLVAAWRDPA